MSEVLETEKWENIVSRKEVEKIFSPKELEDIETIDDMMEAATEEMEQLLYSKRMDKLIREEKKVKKDILTNIKALNKYFILLKLMGYMTEYTTIDKIIEILSSIEEENNCEQEHKNIGTKINKFNYDKYISCREKLIEVKELLKYDSILPEDMIEDMKNGSMVELKDIYNIDGIIGEVKNKIKNFKKSIDTNKKMY